MMLYFCFCCVFMLLNVQTCGWCGLEYLTCHPDLNRRLSVILSVSYDVVARFYCTCVCVVLFCLVLHCCRFAFLSGGSLKFMNIWKYTNRHRHTTRIRSVLFKGSEVFTGSTKSSSPLRTRHKYVRPHHEEVFSFNFLFRSIHVNTAFSTHTIILVWSAMTFGAFMSVQKKKKKNHENYDYETWCNQHESKIR